MIKQKDKNESGYNYATQVIKDALSNYGAKLGLMWVMVLIILAVFAPLLANSNPILISVDSIISSPLALNLTAVDVSLVILFSIFILLWVLNLKPRYKLFYFLILTVITTVLCNVFIEPPKITVYEQYRDAEKAGQYDWVIRTPIQYSPKDYQRDFGDTGLEAPLEATNRTHLFGTDENGADVLSRMIYASRIALGIGFIATGIAMLIGVILVLFNQAEIYLSWFEAV